MSAQGNKDLVRRLVEEVINRGDMELLEELCTPGLVPRMRRLFGSFRSAFPDWREEVVWLVAEGDRVAGRFRCRGTHLGEFLLGEFLREAPTGGRMEVDEVFAFRVEGGRFSEFWARGQAASRHSGQGRVAGDRLSRTPVR